MHDLRIQHLRRIRRERPGGKQVELLRLRASDSRLEVHVADDRIGQPLGILFEFMLYLSQVGIYKDHLFTACRECFDQLPAYERLSLAGGWTCNQNRAKVPLDV